MRETDGDEKEKREKERERETDRQTDRQRHGRNKPFVASNSSAPILFVVSLQRFHAQIEQQHD